ncbi:MAG: hypothetical protein AAGA69_04530, partial [Pseudomonadota bacterium]
AISSIAILALVFHTTTTLLALANNTNLVYNAFPSPAFSMLFAGAWVVAIAALALVVVTVLAVIGDSRTLFQKLRLGAFTLIALLFVWTLTHWNALPL